MRFVTSLHRFAFAILLTLPLLALADHEPQLPSTPVAPPIVVPLPHIAGNVWQGRGHVVQKVPYDPPLADSDSVIGEQWRAVYMSTSGVDGGPREVSGAFFVPRGTPPDGGWPVISLAHGTTGIGTNCGPAQHPELLGYSPVVTSFLERGYAVALSDYEGLGPAGSHPYLEPRTAAFNVIDAVRALREMSPNVSARWVALGYSQGGHAVWAADEFNSFYGHGLQLLGSVALAPAANVTGTADVVSSGSMTEEQAMLYTLLITGLSQYTGLRVQSFLHGSAAEQSAQLKSCNVDRTRRTSVPKKPVPAPVPWRSVVNHLNQSRAMRPATPRDVDSLRDVLRTLALPQRALGTPMLVITGLDDALVLSSWVREAVSQSCALGGRIEYLEVPDTDHQNVLWKRSPTVARWIADRFAGVPAPSNCESGQH
jgi:secretory lipase